MKKRMHTATPANATEVSAIIIGIVIAAIISVLLTAGLTSLIVKGTIGDTVTAPYIFLIRTLAVAIGCIVGTKLVKGKYLLVTGAISVGYIAVLIAMGIILYDGSFNNVLIGAASVLAGGVAACVAALNPLKKSKYARQYRR